METKRSKKVTSSISLAEGTSYDISEATDIIANYAKVGPVKFDESVDVAIRLGLDPKKGEQVIKSNVVLPHGNGRKVRVAVFAEGDDLDKALAAGAVVAGSDDLIARVKAGFLEFDQCIATPDMMPRLAAVSRILGPRGLMPNPKTGTVTKDVEGAVKSFMLGRVEYRLSKDAFIRLSVGRLSFSADSIKENIAALIKSIKAAKPSVFKGNYFVSMTISSTMSPFSVAIKMNSVI